MACGIAALDLLAVLVQEGGYPGPSLATNARASLIDYRNAIGDPT